MFPRYIFHKESEEDLKEFLRTASDLHRNNPEKFVPINMYLRELQSERQQQSTDNLTSQFVGNENDDVIIIDSQPDPTETEKPANQENNDDKLNTFQEVHLDHFNSSVASDLIEIITENLKQEKSISQTDLKKLASVCSDEQIENFMKNIKNDLDTRTVCNFGMAFCDNNDINKPFSFFYEHILFPLLNVEQSPNFQNMFVCVYKKFHTIINRSDIVKKLVQPMCSGIFLQNISKIESELKSEIIRDLIANCRLLEQSHVKVLDSLLDKNTHHSVIKLIINLLASHGETNDKATGKLILALMQILGRNINQFEQPLRQIIAKHKSVWQTKIKKTFDESYQCSQLSQSLIIKH